MNIVVVLVEVEKPVNLGLIARLCENFDVSELRLVNPKLGEDDWEIAKIYSSRASSRIDKAVTYSSLREALSDVDYSVATSAIYRDRGANISRRAVTLNELKRICIERELKKLALVFGRESTGLRRNEIEECDVLLTLETSDRYRSLNLACSVSITLYELFKLKWRRRVRKIADKKVREKIAEYFSELAKSSFRVERKAMLASKAFSNVINRGLPDPREATLIIGVLRLALKHARKI